MPQFMRIGLIQLGLIILCACGNTPDDIFIETPSVPATRISRETRATPRPNNTATPIPPTQTPRLTATPRATVSIGKININTANAETIATLPRIGNVTANRIVQYRQQKGAFRRIEDLKEVSGIGDVIFDAIKERITISD